MKALSVFLLYALIVFGCAPLVDPNIVMGTPLANVPTRTPRSDPPRIWSEPDPQQPTPNTLPDRYAGLHGTETAVGLWREQLDREQAQLQMQLVRDAATSTAGAQMTSTAAADAISTSVAGTQAAQIQIASTAQAAGTQTSYPLTQTSLQATQEVERVQLQVSKIKAIVWPFLFALVFIAFATLGFLWLRRIISAYHLQKSQIRPDDKGRFPAVPEDVIPGKSKRVINMNLMHRAVHDPEIQDDLSPEQALANSHDQRRLEIVRSISESPAMPRIAAAMMKEDPGAPTTPGLVSLEGDQRIPMLRLPDSHLLNGWDGKFLPYGSDENQKLLTVDPAKRPHLMVTGTTGTGKTRYEIRTVVAGALASGWQVIAIGKQADYIPFQDHPNVKLIPANAIKESDKYIRLLKAASEEMFRRDEMLTSKGISTWDRYGGPQTMIVVDDYTAAMMMMPSASAKEVLSWALALAMDGRKYGLNLLLGLQRATWTCISTDLRSQMARITLRVESARESRIVLDESGAETLPDRHFLARLEEGSGLIRGAAFAMTDMETYSFLASRPVKEVGEANWVDAVATDVPTTTPTTVAVDPDADEIAMLADSIRDQWRPEMSKNAVAKLLGKPYAGASWTAKVDRVIAYIASSSTTNRAPDSDPVAA